MGRRGSLEIGAKVFQHTQFSTLPCQIHLALYRMFGRNSDSFNCMRMDADRDFRFFFGFFPACTGRFAQKKEQTTSLYGCFKFV